jgi:hypothetical protein
VTQQEEVGPVPDRQPAAPWAGSDRSLPFAVLVLVGAVLLLVRRRRRDRLAERSAEW